jgi:flagellar biosynthesis protein FlhG
MSRIIAVTSGKGGVGKTNVSVNLSIRLSALGFKTCLFDADLGLANINILLGLVPEYTLADLIDGTCRFEDLVIRDVHGVDIIPGSTGVTMLADLDGEGVGTLIRKLSALDDYDYILIDTAAGISRQVMAFCMAASHVILTVVPEATSLTDAYSLLKVLHQNGYDRPVRVLINRSKTVDAGRRVFEKFNATVTKFLPLPIRFLGALVNDDGVNDAAARQIPFVIDNPDGPASRQLDDIAARLVRMDAKGKGEHSMGRFLRQVLVRIGNVITSVPKPGQPNTGRAIQPSHTPEPPETIAQDELATQVLMALQHLVKNTDRIIGELAALRQSISGRDTPVDDPAETPVQTSGSAPVIELDFEKYVRTRSESQSGRGDSP